MSDEKTYDPLLVAIGTVIRAQRKKLKRTLHQVADSIRVSLGYLSQVEMGKNSASLEVMMKICAALGLRFSDVMASAELATTPRIGRVLDRCRYEVPGAESSLVVLAVDDRHQSPGGANHRYDFVEIDTRSNPARMTDTLATVPACTALTLLFQNGPLANDGRPNGVTIESVLAACADRLTGFQLGQFANDYNANAIHKITGAIADLQQRTRDRVERGVEGTLRE